MKEMEEDCANDLSMRTRQYARLWPNVHYIKSFEEFLAFLRTVPETKEVTTID